MASRWRTLPLQASASEQLFSWRDVFYTSEQHIMKTLDVTMPPKPFPKHRVPTCVFVHGGSWQRGDKAGMLNQRITERFAAAKYVGVSVNYRLSPQVKHPEHAKDLASALGWIHGNIHKFGGDPDRLFLIGHSAGAHMVLSLLTHPTLFEGIGGSAHKVVDAIKAAVGISGVYNVVKMANAPLYGSLVINPAFGNHVEQWREASILAVLHQATIQKACSSSTNHQLPLVRTPLLLLNAEEDFHLQEDAQELVTRLQEAGNSHVKHLVIPERNHFSIMTGIGAELEAEDPGMIEILKFFEQVKADFQNKKS